MERLTDHKNEHYNQPGCNSCSDYRWRSCKESGEIDDCIQRLTWLRLLDIEDILGDDYDLDRLRELVKADREGRCVVLPCKVGDKVFQQNGEDIFESQVKKIIYDCGHFAFDEEAIGERVFLARESAEAALRGEQA